MLELEGEEATTAWLDAMASDAEIYRNNIVTMQAVSDGEVPGGIIYHYYWFRDQDGALETSEGTELHYFGEQDPGAFVSVSGGGVLASSQNAEQAQEFLAWLTGDHRAGDPRRGVQLRVPGRQRRARPATRCPRSRSSTPPPVDPSSLDGPAVVGLMTDAGLL